MKDLYKLIRNYGAVGLLIYFKIRLGFTNRIAVPNIKVPIKLRKGSSDIATFGQVFIELDYDIDLDDEPKTIIDAGANIGLASIYFANRYPEATIIAIEPESSNYELLKHNVNSYNNVIVLNRALSNISEMLDVEDIGLGHWGFITSKKNKDTMESSSGQSIKTITIDEIMQQYQFEHIDVVKIDIEGYEKELFESNYERWVPQSRNLIVELHDGMKPGCSKSLFSCMCQYSFNVRLKGENLVFKNTTLN